jgi:hypothetical protein
MFTLFSVNPYYGHFHPLTPLAAALRRRGHRVAFATWSGFSDVVARAGFEILPAGIAPFSSWAWVPASFSLMAGGAPGLTAARPAGGRRHRAREPG